jgi:serine/threonine-protein kinase
MRTGETFGSYKLLRRLAAGGMGEIWLAEQKGSAGFSKQVVVKTILECFADDPSLVEMFLDEGRIAANLSHPNIAQTFDLGQCGKGSDAPYYIAMEYVHGRDLRDLLITNIDRKQFVPLNLVLRIIADVCQGLHHAHSVKTPEGKADGIIHRDVSPQNILITFDGIVKIVDFGVAKATERASKTKSGVLKGKYAYMSPEQVRSKPLDGRADVFSVGVVMYELVTGRRLFKRDSEMKTLDAVISAIVPKPRRFDTSVPPEVEAVMLKALSLRPKDRYQSAQEMQLAVENLMIELQLPASSAHLSAFMQEIYGGEEEEEDEKYAGRGSRSRSELMRKMESLPGVADKAEFKLERTGSFTPLSGVAGLESSIREPTRNIRYGERKPLPPTKRRPWMIPVLGLLAGLLGVGGYFAVSALLNKSEPEKSESVASVEPAIKPPPNPVPAAERSGAAPVGVPARVPEPEPAPEPEPEVEPEPVVAPEPEPAKVTPVKKPPKKKKKKRRVIAKKTTGLISVTTEPPADIFLGKNKLGHGSIQRAKVPTGKHKLRVVLRKGTQKIMAVRIKRGEHIEKSVAFGSGKLRIVVLPWANVWVDGKKKGQTPLPAMDLMEGSHRVRLANDQIGKDLTKTVRVRPGKESLIRLDWRQ